MPRGRYNLRGQLPDKLFDDTSYGPLSAGRSHRLAVRQDTPEAYGHQRAIFLRAPRSSGAPEGDKGV